MLWGGKRLMSVKLPTYVLCRNGKLVNTKYRTYEWKPAYREDRPYTDYAFLTFDKANCFQTTQVLDADNDFLNFIRNGDFVQFSHIGGWFEVYVPFRGCLFIISGRREYKTTNEQGEEVVYLNPEYTIVHDEMKAKISSVKKAFKIQQGVGKDTVITFFKNVEGYWESSR